MTDLFVRPAHAGDGAALGSAHARAWHDAYTGVLPAAALEGATPGALAAEWEEAALAPPTGRHRLLVACAGPEVAGFAAVVPGSDPDLDGNRTAELAILIVDPAHQRLGHGSRLLAAVADVAVEDGASSAVTWVLEQDAPLRAFLAGAGWAADGASRELRVDETAPAAIRQIRLHTAFGASGPAGER